MNYISKIVVTSLLCAATAHAATLTVSQDAAVKGGTNSGTNYGSDTVITTVGYGTNEDAWSKGYLMFDASSLPELTSIESLNMVFIGAYDRSARFFLLTGDNATDWQQNTITWDNAPGNVTDSGRNFGTDDIDAILLGNVTGNGSGNPIALTFDQESAFMETFLNLLNTGDRTATIVFALDSSTRSFSITSSESTSYAAAYLTYTAIPEPAVVTSLALGAAALGCVALRRKKRVA